LERQNVLEACRILLRMIEDYEMYFDRYGYANSEGRKMLERALHIILEEEPSLRRLAYRVRRDASLEAIRKLYTLAGCDSY
jgi:hypothetical protein